MIARFLLKANTNVVLALFLLAGTELGAEEPQWLDLPELTNDNPTIDANEFVMVSSVAFEPEAPPVNYVPTHETYAEDERHELYAHFGDGFEVSSWDGEFLLRWHILGQVDFKMFSPGDQDPAARSGVYMPRTRIYFEGQLTEPYEYEVSLQRSLEGQFDLLDANFNVRLHDDLVQIRAGRFLVPYSYAWYDHLEQYFLVPERALFPLNFGLSRASGGEIWGELGEGVVQYAFAGADGRLAGLADNSTTADGVAYLNLRPFLHSKDSPLRHFNIGGSMAMGKSYRAAELLPLKTSIQASENDESAISASAIFLEFEPGAVAFGDRFQAAIHTAFYHGSWTVEAEWQTGRFGVAPDEHSAEEYYWADGFNVSIGWLVTGETIQGRKAIKPLRPIDPRCGLVGGAVELFARYARLTMSDEVFADKLVDADKWTNDLSVVDLGVNWYWNEYLKWTFTWQHSAYASPVLVNEEHDRYSDANDLYWIRGQLYF